MNNVIDVEMGRIMTSTNETPIIGTSALATCVGFLAIDHEQQKAIVSHVSPSLKPTIKDLLDVMREENFLNKEQFDQCVKNLLAFEKYDLFGYNESFKELLSKIEEYQVPSRTSGGQIEIRIIDGYFPNHDNVGKQLENFFSYITSIFDVNNTRLSNGEVETQMISKNEGFISFYYDASKDKFVTQEVINPSTTITKKM